MVMKLCPLLPVASFAAIRSASPPVLSFSRQAGRRLLCAGSFMASRVIGWQQCLGVDRGLLGDDEVKSGPSDGLRACWTCWADKTKPR